MKFQLDFKGFQLVFHWNFTWYHIEIWRRFQMDFPWYFIEISNEYDLDFYLDFHLYFIVFHYYWNFIKSNWISNGNQLVFHWNFYWILTVFQMYFHWNFIEISIVILLKFPMDFPWYFIEIIHWKSSWNSIEISMKYQWKSIGNPVEISMKYQWKFQ